MKLNPVNHLHVKKDLQKVLLAVDASADVVVNAAAIDVAVADPIDAVVTDVAVVDPIDVAANVAATDADKTNSFKGSTFQLGLFYLPTVNNPHLQNMVLKNSPEETISTNAVHLHLQAKHSLRAIIAYLFKLIT